MKAGQVKHRIRDYVQHGAATLGRSPWSFAI
jgi:hypothetical protein